MIKQYYLELLSDENSENSLANHTLFYPCNIIKSCLHLRQNIKLRQRQQTLVLYNVNFASIK